MYSQPLASADPQLQVEKRTGIYIKKKKNAYKWTYIVQTWVIQGSTAGENKTFCLPWLTMLGTNPKPLGPPLVAVFAGAMLSTSLFLLLFTYTFLKSLNILPWLVWLSGLRVSLWTKGSLVQIPVRAHSWVVAQVPSRGRTRGNHTLMFLSLSFSLPYPLYKNK